MKTNNRSESGQIVVIMAIALIAMLGFTALAIDGGMIMSDRRYDQSVADASALAAAAVAAQSMDNHSISAKNFDCSSSAMQAVIYEAEQAAINRGANNNFVLDDNIYDDDNGVEATCDIVNHNGIKDYFIFINVEVSSNVNTSFAQMFYKKPIRNTVTAVARVTPRQPYAYGFAIASLSPDCDDSLYFDGHSKVVVTDSGVVSNSCITTNGGIEVHASGDNAGIFFKEKVTINGGVCDPDNPSTCPLSPFPSKTSVEVPTKVSDQIYNCDGLGAGSIVGGVASPGIYSGFDIHNAATSIHLSPGLYCMDGDITANGGSFTGDDVTIVMRHGDVKINGNVTVQLSARSTSPNQIENGWLFIVEDATNPDADLDLLGNAASYYEGTVYNPTGDIGIGGGSNLNDPGPTYSTQIIAYSITVHGNSQVDILFNEDKVASSPPLLDLIQ